MPIIPSVFQPIRHNDVQRRPIKTYKRYFVTSTNFVTSSGYLRHDAIYRKHVPHIFADSGQGVGNRTFPVNSEDNTNKHVVWNTIDHRYYRSFVPEKSFDFTDVENEQRFLWYSASIFTAPYGQVGEKIKHGTFEVTSSIGDTTINLTDDGNGNLRDPMIDSSSFASASRNFFYMSFNDLYRRFDDADSLETITSDIKYKLNGVKKSAIMKGDFRVRDGIKVTGSLGEIDSGLSVQLPPIGHIRIPHSDKFDRFGKCDDWTISFWHTPYATFTGDMDIISKYGIRSEQYLDARDGKRKTRDITQARVDSVSGVSDHKFAKIRTPFVISFQRSSGNDQYYFQSSDGTNQLAISSSLTAIDPLKWQNVVIRNSASICEMFINGVAQNSSGSLPDNITANNADVVFGSPNGTEFADGQTGYLAEVRMYDYAVSSTGITSLANNHYLSASCYQTNVAGNVLYKNGQAVVSSPLPKYNSGSGVFGNTWDVTYRGTHTLYENEVLVRVPKDQFNVSMNPTATYRPVTVGQPCATNEVGLPPGELRKSLFVSGTLKPYITTIGLYDDQARMLATAKLSTPVQKLDDVDMNFIVRWDY